MRTAEEILNTIDGESIWGDLMKNKGNVYYEDDLILLINEARKEAIEECAERATTREETEFSDDVGNYEVRVVDKQSILSLINELK